MNEEEQQKIIESIHQAKQLDPRLGYLLVVKRGDYRKEALDRLASSLSDEGFRFWIIQTREDPRSCLALYKLRPEQPE